jgi:tRNA(fMet)-specific endonuclease VapC
LPFQQYGLALNPQRALKIEQAVASILTSVNILSLGTAEAKQAAQNYLSLKN